MSLISPTHIATGLRQSLRFNLYIAFMDSSDCAKAAIPYTVSVGTAINFPSLRRQLAE